MAPSGCCGVVPFGHDDHALRGPVLAFLAVHGVQHNAETARRRCRRRDRCRRRQGRRCCTWRPVAWSPSPKSQVKRVCGGGFRGEGHLLAGREDGGLTVKAATAPYGAGNWTGCAIGRSTSGKSASLADDVLAVFHVVEGDAGDVAGDGGAGERRLIERPDVAEGEVCAGWDRSCSICTSEYQLSRKRFSKV